MKSTRETDRPFAVDAAAVAVSATVPLTVAPGAGAVRVIVGGGHGFPYAPPQLMEPPELPPP